MLCNDIWIHGFYLDEPCDTYLNLLVSKSSWESGGLNVNLVINYILLIKKKNEQIYAAPHCSKFSMQLN